MVAGICHVDVAIGVNSYVIGAIPDIPKVGIVAAVHASGTYCPLGCAATVQFQHTVATVGADVDIATAVHRHAVGRI
ncbi:MAG: hypothetical protein U9R15_04675, partial [Chloroflexota bacterium]|nr:hypothetical protein [Chloroflexota bacterium]